MLAHENCSRTRQTITTGVSLHRENFGESCLNMLRVTIYEQYYIYFGEMSVECPAARLATQTRDKLLQLRARALCPLIVVVVECVGISK